MLTQWMQLEESVLDKSQNSVFECIFDDVKCREVKHILENIIDKEKDSLRFYYLGNNYKSKVEHIGIKPSIDMEGVLLV